MNLTVSISDETKLLAAQKALDLQNSTRNVPLTMEEFIDGFVNDFCTGLVSQYLSVEITPFAFLNRFTPAERAAIRTAALTNGELADYVAMVESAPVVVLTHELTVTGVNAVEAAGLIAQGRGAQILSLVGPVLP